MIRTVLESTVRVLEYPFIRSIVQKLENLFCIVHFTRSCQYSSKKSAAAILPGARRLGGVVMSTTAQSGRCGFCKELLWSCPSLEVTPELTTT